MTRFLSKQESFQSMRNIKFIKCGSCGRFIKRNNKSIVHNCPKTDAKLKGHAIMRPYDLYF